MARGRIGALAIVYLRGTGELYTTPQLSDVGYALWYLLRITRRAFLMSKYMKSPRTCHWYGYRQCIVNAF